MDVRVGLYKESWALKVLMLLNCGVREDSWESLGLQWDPTSPSLRKPTLNIHWKDWCWSWNCNSLVTLCEELTHLKISWCWERMKVGKEGDYRGWDGWMALPTEWTWVGVTSRSRWWTEAWHAAVHGLAKSRTQLSDSAWLKWTEPRLFIGKK